MLVCSGNQNELLSAVFKNKPAGTAVEWLGALSAGHSNLYRVTAWKLDGIPSFTVTKEMYERNDYTRLPVLRTHSGFKSIAEAMAFVLTAEQDEDFPLKNMSDDEVEILDDADQILTFKEYQASHDRVADILMAKSITSDMKKEYRKLSFLIHWFEDEHFPMELLYEHDGDEKDQSLIDFATSLRH